MNSYLPIGSVVKIKESDVNLMIIGYNFPKDDKIYDYVAVIHLVGIGLKMAGRSTDLVVFNRSSVKEVFFVGYMDRKVKNKMTYMNFKKEDKK